jgi:hypothetical protein
VPHTDPTQAEYQFVTAKKPAIPSDDSQRDDLLAAFREITADSFGFPRTVFGALLRPGFGCFACAIQGRRLSAIGARIGLLLCPFAPAVPIHASDYDYAEEQQ